MKERIRKNFKSIMVFMAFLMCSIIMMGHQFNIAYAATETTEEPTLSKLYVSEGKDIEFEEDEHVYIVDVLESDEDIYIKAKPERDYYNVKINGKELKADEKYKYNTKLIEGKNKFEVKVTDDKTSSESTYTVYIYRGGKEAVYLKNLKIDGKSFGFNKKNTLYSIELDEDTKYIEIEAETEDDNYEVYINDIKIDKKKEIAFKQTIGVYELKISVKDTETERSAVYKLDLYLGMPITPNSDEVIKNANKKNQWLIMNGRWKYKNEKCEYLKSTWFRDKSNGKYYYFDSKGNMKTGWITWENKEYYLGPEGDMQTGWLYYSDAWYYLGFDGSMQIGWLKDGDKWYYFDEQGAMQTNWILIGDNYYYLNEDGSMHTGWIKDEDKWRYLNDDGRLAKGQWVSYNDAWYYINGNGTMRTGWLYKDENYYYLNDDGIMQTGSKLIDEYLYKFNSDGSVNFD